MSTFPLFDDYTLRVQVMDTADNFGGTWRNATTPNFTFPAYATAGGDELVGVRLNHLLDLPESGVLKVSFEAVPSVSTGGLSIESYSFNFMSGRRFVFRYDNHPKHREPWLERTYNTTCHVHTGPTKFPTGVVEFETAVEDAVTYQSTHTFVPNTSPFVLDASTSRSTHSKYRA
jgi:hypothetical protein